jgi:prepilin-type N-terminal cleavage/methylation domain-containing protein
MGHMGMNTKAFSLIELSVVLAVIGMIAGAIVGGQALIRNSQLSGVVADYAKYTRAVSQFKNQYKALPGDFADATEYWGIAGGTGSDATCAAAASVGPETCNGDGNGTITSSTGSAESQRFWQHLSNAGYIQGSFNGIPAGAATSATSNANAPAGSLPSTLWGTWWYVSTQAGTANLLHMSYLQHLWLGKYSAGSLPNGPAFSAKEAQSVDSKMDDGMPGLGTVIAFRWSTCTNATDMDDINTTYKLYSTATSTPNLGQTCTLIFRNLFNN